MRAPWNVRVREGRGYFTAEVRIKGRWYDAGTAPTWFQALLQGVFA